MKYVVKFKCGFVEELKSKRELVEFLKLFDVAEEVSYVEVKGREGCKCS